MIYICDMIVIYICDIIVVHLSSINLTVTVYGRHIGEEHRQDGRTTAQLRVQMQVVVQLELQVLIVSLILIDTD